ncbi:MAG: 30S ribosomal protein S9 [Deltaproteobacteria bacterium RBG_16_50_11]|nr:MAG: 30S ribosomal protein S9 [Deltaproteobacteria bacterium RBG_16_50_11]
MADQFNATGKRKTAIARVRMEPGEGKFLVNERALREYFTRETGEMVVLQPFDITGTRNRFDVTVNVQGGGMTGQAEAIRHGISKALLLYNQEFKDALKKAGLLTRDSRIKERKKYGLRGARRRPQYSKR